jgi:phospholipid/cholesterol/gamma-HCH transport system permease protein
MFRNIGELVILLLRTVQALPLVWRQRLKVIDQLYEIGHTSLLMVCILSFFIGGVLTLQTGPLLAERGLEGILGSIVGVSMCREFAPVMMAILIAGRNGSAIAAELGSMKVYQEIDALRTMYIDPVHFLVLPRVVAVAIALPILSLFSILVGWLGGALVASINEQIRVPTQLYYESLRQSVDFSDLANGLFKSFCFAIMIGIVCCHQGLTTIGGPRGIGRSVTKAVVNSIVLILIFDYVLSRFLQYFE